MKVWTIQQKEVIDIISGNDAYAPDFKYSQYLKKMPQLKPLYDYILKSFDQCNGTHSLGLVFAMTSVDGEINNINEFLDFIMNHSYAIESMIKNIVNSNSYVLELEYEEKFNPIAIDINDFQFLMPPVIYMPSYSEEDEERILYNISHGIYQPSNFPSGVMQLHLPYIKKKNVINIYKVAENDTQTKEPTKQYQNEYDETLPF